MNSVVSTTPAQLPELLLELAVVRPVFLWGAPGIGKSSLVEQFAADLGMECVTLLGTQLAPEDLIGVPRIDGNVSVFCPPRMIARDEPYVLFLDELNGSSMDVQRSFYSLIHDRRLGEYRLPAGSVVIGAGNRAQDHAITRQMSSALVNRMLHIHLESNHRDWLAWARGTGVHQTVVDFIGQNPTYLTSPPPPHEEPFSTPRSWHMLSDALSAIGDPPVEVVKLLAYGTLSPAHAQRFSAYWKNYGRRFDVGRLISGDATWPADDPDGRYALAMSLRSRLIAELPAAREGCRGDSEALRHGAIRALSELAGIHMEIAQMVVSSGDDGVLPDWFLAEVVRHLPRIIAARS